MVDNRPWIIERVTPRPSPTDLSKLEFLCRAHRHLDHEVFQFVLTTNDIDHRPAMGAVIEANKVLNPERVR